MNRHVALQSRAQLRPRSPSDHAPEKSCGSCSLCCKLLPIEVEMPKPAGEWCTHCAPGRGGCTIFGRDERPMLCGQWLCGWRSIAGIPDHWHPSRSRMIIMPPDGSGGFLLRIVVDLKAPGAWRARPYIDDLRVWATPESPICLAIGGRNFIFDGVKEHETGLLGPDDVFAWGRRLDGSLGIIRPGAPFFQAPPGANIDVVTAYNVPAQAYPDNGLGGPRYSRLEQMR